MGRTELLFSLFVGGLGASLGCGGQSAPPEVGAAADSPVSGADPGPPTPVLGTDGAGTPAEEKVLAGSGANTDAPSGALHEEAVPSGTKVLHVGDSFAGALGLPLGRLFAAEGVSSTLKHTDASYLTDWAWDGNLQKYIWRYNPDLVLITLGANELEIQDPAARAKTIKKLVSLLGERPCVWVAIPLWAGPKNGLLDVIAENASPCLFLDTNQLMDVAAMPRIRDGIHPTEGARDDWAAVVFEWLRRHRKAEAGRPWSLRPD